MLRFILRPTKECLSHGLVKGGGNFVYLKPSSDLLTFFMSLNYGDWTIGTTGC